MSDQTKEGVGEQVEQVRSAPAAARVFQARQSSLSFLRIRETIPMWLIWVLGAIPVLVLLLVWYWITAGATIEERIISGLILPSPKEVVLSFPKLWFERALTRNLMLSLGRVVGGFALAVAVVFPLGVLMGAFTKVKAMFTPLSVLSAYLPIPTLVPLTLSLFGTGESQKIIFLAVAFSIYLLPLFVSAVDVVDDNYVKTAYTLGATRRSQVLKVMLPIAWPEIYNAMRMGFGVGWSYIMLAELVGMDGLGGLIMSSQRQGPREHIYLILLVIVVMAFLTDRLWAAIGKRLFPYRGAKR